MLSPFFNLFDNYVFVTHINSPENNEMESKREHRLKNSMICDVILILPSVKFLKKILRRT